MGTRSELDKSHSELDLRMTEGDPMDFAFWVRDAQDWAGSLFVAAVHPGSGWTATPLAAPTVVVAAANGPEPENQDLLGLNVDITNAPVAALTSADTPFIWGMKDVGGTTRFGGWLHVEPRVV
jgi:hypothetical protein